MPFKANQPRFYGGTMSDPQLGNADLGSIITNATARKSIYAVWVIAGLILGGIQAWYGADAAPHWFPQALALYGYLTIPIGGLAWANTPKKS